MNNRSALKDGNVDIMRGPETGVKKWTHHHSKPMDHSIVVQKYGYFYSSSSNSEPFINERKQRGFVRKNS